jgi:hypothetical protein
VGQTTKRNRARLPSLFGMKFTQVTSQYSEWIREVQVTIKVWVHVKVPSCRISCKSSNALQLFKELNALLQTIDCRKVWGKQPMGTEQGSTNCLVWNSHKCPANTPNELEEYKQQSKYRCMWRHLPAAYPAKSVMPFSFSNNELHSCRLLIAEKCGANNQQEQSNVPLTVWYEIHTSAQPIQQMN